MARRAITLEWDNWDFGGAQFRGGGIVGYQSAIMGSARLSPCYAVLSAKSKNRNGNYDQGFRGKSILKNLSLSS